MAGRVTLKDVAAECGVSRATVSLVLNDSYGVSAATRQRVREAMARLGYVYDRGAAQLRTQRSMTVSLVVTDVHNSFFAGLAMAIEDVLYESGYTLLLGYSHDDLDRQERLLASMTERRVDGVVLLPTYQTTAQTLERALVRGNVPHVLIARHVRGYTADYVGPENVRAGNILADHLAALGCDTVAFVGGPVESTARSDREHGLRDGLVRHGLGGLDRSIPSAATREGGAEAAQALLAEGPVPTGIVCYSDVVAFGVLEVLAEAGARVGRDIAVASFDNVPESALTRPPLTSVATFPDQIGAEAARLLLQRVAEPAARPRTVLCAPELVPRESTNGIVRSTRPS